MPVSARICQGGGRSLPIPCHALRTAQLFRLLGALRHLDEVRAKLRADHADLPERDRLVEDHLIKLWHHGSLFERAEVASATGRWAGGVLRRRLGKVELPGLDLILQPVHRHRGRDASKGTREIGCESECARAPGRT